MSSISNEITPFIIGNSTNMPAVDQQIAPEYKALLELTQAEFEELLRKALVQARKTAHEATIADPQTMLAMLAMYGIQEVHALGFKSPSAIRAMAIKAFAHERATKSCLFQAKRELIAAAKEREGAKKAVEGKKEAKEEDAADVVNA